jgi:hypothetical protein
MQSNLNRVEMKILRWPCCLSSRPYPIEVEAATTSRRRMRMVAAINEIEAFFLSFLSSSSYQG